MLVLPDDVSACECGQEDQEGKGKSNEDAEVCGGVVDDNEYNRTPERMQNLHLHQV